MAGDSRVRIDRFSVDSENTNDIVGLSIKIGEGTTEVDYDKVGK